MEEEKVKNWRQFMVSISANLVSSLSGIAIIWSSPSIVKLEQNNSPLGRPINSDESGWITSFLSLGAFFGPLIVWLLLDRIGRKWTLLVGSGLFTISTILLLSIEKIWAIYVARLLQGFSIGIVMAVAPIYNAEIATDNLRGAIGSLMSVLTIVGNSYYSILGGIDSPYITYSVLQWACLPFCILFPITFIFMPETPHYYIAKGQKEKALKSLKFLRGQSESIVLEEYGKIKVLVEESLNNKGTYLDLFKRKENLRALFITTPIIIFQELMGPSAIFFNVQSIVLASKSITPLTYFITISIVQCISGFFSVYTIENFGRKISVLLSCGFVSITMFALGVYFYIQKSSGDVSHLIWLPATCLLFYTIAFVIGYSPVPWILVGELFASDVKSLASSVNVSICWLLSFIVSKLYPILRDNFGLYVVFWIFGSFTILAFIYISIFLFETKGLSLQEIQNKLSMKS